MGVWGAWKGFFFSVGYLVQCVGGRWGLGWFLGGWGAWKGLFFSGGCLVHCVGGRWGFGQFLRVCGAWKGFSFSGRVSGPLCRWELGIGAGFGDLGGLEGVFL